MLRKDEGVVLRTARSGETSRTAVFLGRESGKIRLMGKGALLSKSPFRGALEPGNILEVVYYFKEGRSVYFLKDTHLQAALDSERRSLPWLAASLAVVQLLDGVCYWGSPEARIVDLVGELAAVEPSRGARFAFLAFEFKLLEILGVLPEFSECAECGAPLEDGYYDPADGASRCRAHARGVGARGARHGVALDRDTLSLLRAMVPQSIAGMMAAPPDRSSRKRLGKILHWTYTFHVQGYSLPEALKLITHSEDDTE